MSALEGSVAERLTRVLAQIHEACAKSNRAAEDVQLLAVSKTKPMELIREAFSAGQTKFGENYVQEAVGKAKEFRRPEWHLIGSLQTNKVKYLENYFAMIHSVDRERLVSEIEKMCARIPRELGDHSLQDILIQVHVGDETSKEGARFDDVPQLIESINQSPHLRLRGLMTLPPITDDESIGRSYFATVREALERWRPLLPANRRESFDTLSMGTSHDFSWAIREGATMVRIGTAIFGSRESV